MYDVNIHLGVPKCMSTKLQASLNKSTIIAYRGFRPDLNPSNWYCDNTIQELLDCDLKYSSRIKFEEKKEDYEKYLRDFIELNPKKDIWISSENLSSRFTLEELDVYEKLERLLSLLKGYRVGFHVLYRSYFESLFSNYKELVSRKYNKRFDYFLDEICFFENFGTLAHIIPSILLKNIKVLYKNYSNFHVHFYLPSQNSQKLPCLDHISNSWKINLDNGYENQLNYSVEDLLNLNRENYVGHSLSNLMELHRYGLAIDENTFNFWEDRKLRKDLLIAAQDKSVDIESYLKIYLKSNTYQRILTCHHAANEIDLAPVTYHGNIDYLLG